MKNYLTGRKEKARKSCQKKGETAKDPTTRKVLFAGRRNMTRAATNGATPPRKKQVVERRNEATKRSPLVQTTAATATDR